MANQNSQQGAPVAEEQTLNQSEAFFLKYKKAIIAAVVALVAIIAGVVLYQTYVSGPNEQKASTMLAKGQQYFMAGDYQKALNGDSASYKGFLNVVNEYGSTKAGNLANLYVGLCYANLDKWKEAAQYIEKFSGADDDMVSPAAIGALGNVYAHLNQLDKAVTTLKKAAESADNNSLSPTFLIQAGEILESQGKKAEALELYKQVKDKYFNSMQRQTIDAYIERASN